MSDSLQRNGHNSHDGMDRFKYIPNSNNMYEAEQSGLDPKKVLLKLLRYKWIILLFLICGATAAWFYASTVTPTYESSGMLIISSGEQSPNDKLSKIISQTTGYGTTSTLENELQVLKSRKFSREVAKKLTDIDSADIDTYPILWTELETGEISRASVEQVAKRLRSKTDFAKVVEEADVIKVSYSSVSPKEASKIVNLTMEVYKNNSTQQSRQAARKTAEFLKEEKEKLKKRLQQAEQDLRAYMDATGIVQVNQQATGMVEQRANTELELQRINLELKAVKENIANYKEQLEKINPGLTGQFSEAIDPRIKNAQELLARYEQERSMLISKNPGIRERDPVPPRLQFLDKEINRLQKEIKQLSEKLFTSDNRFLGMNSEDRAQTVSGIQSRLVELRMEKNQLQSRKAALNKYKNEVDAEFNSLPEGMIKLAKLKRDVRISEELYLNASRQYADMSVWAQSQYGFGRIIDPASTPDAPVSPNKKIFILLGLMLGGVLSAGFIVIKEFRDNSVNNVGQLRTIHMPPLTVVPAIDQIVQKDKKSFKTGKGEIPDEAFMLQNRTSKTSEAIKRLKNNIIYQNGEQPPKSIVVTSPEKGDGKSTIAANLAVSFAEGGYWTLVIGADFRRPKLHTYFGISEEHGLSDYLNGESSFEHLLKDTDIDTLKVITAGKSVDMPEVLSNSKVFKHLLQKMEEVFDVIIIDTPPFGIISDSTALLTYADAATVVAKYRKTNKGMLLKTIDELREINANVTSIVLNDFDYRKEVGNYYGDGYYQTLYANYEEYL